MRNLYISILVIGFAVLIPRFESSASERRTYVKVAAGSLDRRETVVSFALPKDLKAKSYALRDESGRMIALQVDADHQATFVLTELKAGSTKKYRLVESKASAESEPDVRIMQTSDSNVVGITVSGRHALAYQAQPDNVPRGVKEIFRRGGYIRSVYTPLQRNVADDYPPDHYHHHGIWAAWTKTEFEGRHPDFWNMGDGTGKVEFVALDKMWSGAVHGGFTSRHRYVDLSGAKPTTVLNEEWKVTVYNLGLDNSYSMFDMIVTHNCATASPLVLPEYRYGGIGFRGHRQWLDKDNCFFLTSEGKDRNNGHGTRARWCHIGGRIDGLFAGIAVLDHPANFRAPQPMRINPDQPFFCYSPSLMGQWEITPGKPYVSRYRFIVYEGRPDKAKLDRLWNDYANPPQVEIAVE
ncbi:MAG TPA: PmoA family protein [Blastocatellia bacterium]|nr:PmoA family protein [Blastocatellia bacterium]